MQNERRPPSTRSRRFWLLSGGIARCALCGNAYSPHTVHDRDKIRPYYRCYSRFNHGLEVCTNGRSTPAGPLEDAVWKAVRSLCSDPERVLSQYDVHVERLRRGMRGDPDAEVRVLLQRQVRRTRPPIVAGRAYCSERKSLWAALLLTWSAIWLVLVAAGRSDKRPIGRVLKC